MISEVLEVELTTSEGDSEDVRKRAYPEIECELEMETLVLGEGEAYEERQRYSKLFPLYNARQINHFRFTDLKPIDEGLSWMVRWHPEDIRVPLGPTEYNENRIYVVHSRANEEGRYDRSIIGTLSIPRMIVGHVKDWTDDHEVLRTYGFKDVAEMVKYIQSFHSGRLKKDLDNVDVIVAYALEWFKPFDQEVPAPYSHRDSFLDPVLQRNMFLSERSKFHKKLEVDYTQMDQDIKDILGE